MREPDRSGAGLSLAEAAKAVGLSRSRVDALVRSGRIRARRVGHQYVIDDVSELEALPRRAGRPMSARMAWALLLMGDGRSADWVAPTERSRLRRHLARLRQDLHPEVLLQALVVNRADRLILHTPEPIGLVADGDLLPSGISDAGAGLSAGESYEGYVHNKDLPKVVRRHLLVEPARAQPNVWLHASEFVPRESLRLQVAADLAEHGGPRERSRARGLVQDALGMLS